MLLEAGNAMFLSGPFGPPRVATVSGLQPCGDCPT
jgi:hypothetical protein